MSVYKQAAQAAQAAAMQQDPRREGQLFTYYCLCGEYVLICDTHIYHMPVRKTDKASVLRKAQITYKLNVSPAETVVHLKRPGGVERQTRYSCKRCGLWVAYEPNDKSPHLYLVDGAMVRNQTDAHSVLQLEGERRKEDLAALAAQASQAHQLTAAQVTATVLADIAAGGSNAAAAAALITGTANF